jgi:hypothetical protein
MWAPGYHLISSRQEFWVIIGVLPFLKDQGTDEARSLSHDMKCNNEYSLLSKM